MATIHFILQGKGGVGKSMIASMLFQCFIEADYNTYGYDTDPVNKTLSAFTEYKSSIKQIDIMQEDGDNIDSRKFDLLLEELANAAEDSQIVIDNGASSFIALGSYIADSDMLGILTDAGHNVFLHTVITGGQALLDTLNGFNKLVSNFPTADIVVWKNPYFGKLELDNKQFDDFKVIKENQNRIYATIELPIGNKDLIGKDLELLFAKKQGFQAGINGSNPIAVKSRLKKYWAEIKSRIDSACIF